MNGWIKFNYNVLPVSGEQVGGGPVTLFFFVYLKKTNFTQV